ncbi:MAG: thiamine diphosphokinase [Eubacteriales bacterium]|nr:thiamine diphosphokinase [Eubacteriales bacterium]
MWQALVLSGDIKNPDRIRALLSRAELIWASDGGLDHLLDLGITADYYLGDGDSLSDKGKDYLQNSRLTREVFPVLKDETDSALTLRRMLQEDQKHQVENSHAHAVGSLDGDSGLMFLAALGARVDHVLANLDLATRYVRKDFPILLTDGETFIWILKGPFDSNISIPLDIADEPEGPRNYYTLLAQSDEVTDLNFSGVLWPLHRRKLFRGINLGVSNRRLAGQVPHLSFDSGILRLIISRE